MITINIDDDPRFDGMCVLVCQRDSSITLILVQKLVRKAIGLRPRTSVLYFRSFLTKVTSCGLD